MPTVAELIRRHHTAIFKCWMEQANRAASARGLSEPALANLMPRYLESLGAVLPDGRKYVESHFATRLRQGFLVSEVVEEFALLGRCIAETWAAAPPEEWPDPTDVDQLRDELHRISARVVEMFASHMHEDEQTEKRYLRMLQDIASAALHGGTAAFRDRLPEVLVLVMEAMGAQSAGIMLRSGDHALVTAATAGAVEPAPYATTLEGASFAAAVAHSEESTSILDASSAEVEVPDAVRRSKIRSLLGTRLCSVYGLSGIIYVGLAEIRPFTAREVRRLEVLAQYLAVHLENASLVADLGTKIDALHAEQTLREHFVSVLAHDLRGPLAAAKLAAQLVKERPEVLELRRELAIRIDRNLEWMDRMIRDLLDANRIRAGARLPVHLGDCDLGPIAYGVTEELRALHGARIELEGERHLRGIWSADELRRALWNLVTNAAKYGDPRRPIRITLHRAGERARVAVHNWGPPIAAEDQERLFEPFARARAATHSGQPGWGLGLALVRECAQAHGGTVSVESTHEAGTTFTIELPLDARPSQLAPDDTGAPPSAPMR